LTTLAKLGGGGLGGGFSGAGGGVASAAGAGGGGGGGDASFLGPDEKNLSMLTIFFKNPHYWESWRSSISYGSLWVNFRPAADNE